MDEWIKLRRKIRNQEVPLRQSERETGIHRKTLRKIRDNSQPPGLQGEVLWIHCSGDTVVGSQRRSTITEIANATSKAGLADP